MMTVLDALRRAVSDIEEAATDALAGLGPWLAPIPSAALVARASVTHLGWSQPIGLIAGAIIEVLGLTATSTALALWDYNESKRKIDPAAPLPLAVVLVGFYYVSTIGLTVLLDITPGLARFAPALFPTLALVGTVNLALRAQHKRRMTAIEAERQERKASRQVAHQPVVVETSGIVSNDRRGYANLDVLQAGRKAKLDARLDALLDVYRDNPSTGATEAARLIGVSRQTIYTYDLELEKAGKLRKNGGGWEVLV